MIAIRIDAHRNNFATFIDDRSIPQLDSRISRIRVLRLIAGPPPSEMIARRPSSSKEQSLVLIPTTCK